LGSAAAPVGSLPQADACPTVYRLGVIAYTLIKVPNDKAGSPDEPAMPQAIM